METITETTNRTEQVKTMALGHLWELCYRAHSNTSFSPEWKNEGDALLDIHINKSDVTVLGDFRQSKGFSSYRNVFN